MSAIVRDETEQLIQDGTEQLVKHDIDGETEKEVGIVGSAANSDDTIFVWNQDVFFRSEDGYSMSQSLFQKLYSLGVDYIHISALDKTVTYDEFAKKSKKVSFTDSRFRGGQQPSEDQYVFPKSA